MTTIQEGMWHLAKASGQGVFTVNRNPLDQTDSRCRGSSWFVQRGGRYCLNLKLPETTGLSDKQAKLTLGAVLAHPFSPPHGL
ncbi:MAG: hypothetical protein HW380_2856 [Magnetococcales bacterium]|nr:hypothetical protein [Magnetococcales bacterium]